MSETVNLPALGESVTEGTVTRWLKNVGDHVEVDEPLLEVSTDKVDTEIPSPVAGVLEEILAEEDDTIDVGAPLAKIGDGSGAAGSSAPSEEAKSEDVDEGSSEETSESSGEDASAEASEESAESEESTPVQEPEPAAKSDAAVSERSAEPAQPSAPAASSSEPVDVTGNAGYVTPLVRKLANQHGVDLSDVTGTGVGGRIRKEDVLAAASPSRSDEPSRPAGAVSELRGTTQPMSRLRKVAAEQAVASSQATAQVTAVVEADVTRVAEIIAGDSGASSFLPYLAHAAVQALQQHPVLNAAVDGDQIIYPASENLSIAVETDRGMLSPVIKDAGSLDVSGLDRAISELAERTRSNSLTPDELSGGTFTVATSEERGTLIETPVVFLPQSAALSAGAVVKRPVITTVDGADAIAIRSVVYLSLSYDQRIIDSSDASHFLSTVVEFLES